MKKLLSVLPSTLQGGFRGGLLFLALLTTTALWAYDFQSGDLYYNITSSSAPYTVEVTSKSSSYPYNNGVTFTSAAIPETVTYNGTTYSVTSIGDWAFGKCSSLTSIIIPESVTSIGDYAFRDCSSLTSITIPESVTRIGFWTFSDCSSLTSVTIPESVTSIGPWAFSNCSSLTSLTIPNSVMSIEACAFENCSSLTSITIPEIVTFIGDYAFRGCSSLPIENNLRYADIFLVGAVDKTLSTYSIKKGTKWIGGSAFSFCSALTSITIPNSVTSIGYGAFENCSSLTSITIPESVTSIRSHAFSDCSSLTSITIPNSVTSIADEVFSGCSGLTSIIVEGGNTIYDSREHCNAIVETATNTLIAGCQNTTIPNSVTSIGDYAFAVCSALTSINIPNSVTSIGYGAFENCSSLTSITIPNSVTSIGEYAFRNCKSLTSVTIPNSVTSIGGYAFSGCSLTKTNYTGDIAGWCNIKFGSSDSNPIFCSHNLYINGQEVKDLVIPNMVDTIHNYAFYNCSSLTSITIPNSVTSIGRSAFSSCSALTSIICEATTPPTLGSDVFYQVSKSIPVYVPCGCVSVYKAASTWKYFTKIQEPQAEYSIQVSTSNSQMGTAKVDYNTFCDGSQITATANYGYHFVQWSDGVTDNPRTLTLTQDTVLTAEFAINQYTISTASSHKERGTTAGDTVVDYLEYVTISATANYGYHFTQWNDKNTSNPRQIQATQDQNYTAYFNKNTYSISLSCNEVQGEVEGPTYAEYLDKVTLTATANYGYHFTQWSDGVTDNPRTITLTQDTTFMAEFALTTNGKCGDNLYWLYNNNKLIVTGSGAMYDERPWGLFVDDLTEVVLPEGLTHIGDDAFTNCNNLKAITIPASVTSIGANSFAGCRRIRDVYCYPLMPPYAEATSFANYNANLNVPCDFLEDYQYDPVFGSFKYFNCMGAESDNTDSDEVVVTPGTTDVTIIWPTEDNAYTYTIVIKKNGQVVCTLVFDAYGRLLNIAFAPGRDGNRPAQYAEQVANGYRFTVTGLTESTKYEYNITTKDESDNTISTHTGEFTTKSNTPTDLENNDIQYPISDTRKLLRDNQLYIYHNGSTYTIMGLEIQ